MGPDALTPEVADRLAKLLYMTKWETQEAMWHFDLEARDAKPLMAVIDQWRKKVKTRILRPFRRQGQIR